MRACVRVCVCVCVCVCGDDDDDGDGDGDDGDGGDGGGGRTYQCRAMCVTKRSKRSLLRKVSVPRPRDAVPTVHKNRTKRAAGQKVDASGVR
jgi:hypothetical protein